MIGRSNLTCLSQYVVEVLDNKGQVDVTYIDFSREFTELSQIVDAKLGKVWLFSGFVDAVVILLAVVVRLLCIMAISLLFVQYLIEYPKV